jgi:hypothetical protein
MGLCPTSVVVRHASCIVDNWVVNSVAVKVLIVSSSKFCQNVCLNEIQIKFEDGLSWVKN